MRAEERQWTADAGWTVKRGPQEPLAAGLVLFFGAGAELGHAAASLRDVYPHARLLGCSTAGEICGTTVADGSVVATAIQFEHTTIQTAYRPIPSATDSAAVGEAVARELAPEGLVHVFVLVQGLDVNGSELVKGLRAGLPPGVAVTGGLAGDGERFSHTSVLLDGMPGNGGVVAVGFYGDRLRVGYGSMGGWDRFGPDRLVTRSEGNVLFELDGGSALDLYRTYLGPYAPIFPPAACSSR